MLTEVLSLSLWPVGLPIASALVALLVTTFVLPLWASLQPNRWTQSLFVVDPVVVIYVALLGVLWLLHWSLLILGASGLLLLVPAVSHRLPIPQQSDSDTAPLEFGWDVWPSSQQIDAGRDRLNEAQGQSSSSSFATLFIEGRYDALVAEATSQIYSRWWDLREHPSLGDALTFLQTLPLRATMITWQHHALVQELRRQDIAIEDEDQLWTDLVNAQVQGAEFEADAAEYVAIMTDSAHAARKVLNPILVSLPPDRAKAADAIAIATLRLLNDEFAQDDALVADVADAWRRFEDNALDLLLYALGHGAIDDVVSPALEHQN